MNMPWERYERCVLATIPSDMEPVHSRRYHVCFNGAISDPLRDTAQTMVWKLQALALELRSSLPPNGFVAPSCLGMRHPY